MPGLGSLVTEQVRQSTAFVSLLLSSLLGALLAPTPIAALSAPHAPATTSGFASAANLATPVETAVASKEVDGDATGTDDPPALAASLHDALPALGTGADPDPLEPRLRVALSCGQGFSARAPPIA